MNEREFEKFMQERLKDPDYTLSTRKSYHIEAIAPQESLAQVPKESNEN